MPSEELLKRVAAYSARRCEGNLAELLLPDGFKQTVRRSRFWFLSCFFKPFQVSLRRLWPLLQLVRSQGMLFPKRQPPIHIEAAQISADFLETFQRRDCASRECGSWDYCEQIGRRAVRIEPEFRRTSLEQFRKVHAAMTSGDLWNVPARATE